MESVITENSRGKGTESNIIFRFLTSHTALAFFYGIFLFIYEIKFARNFASAVHPLLIAWSAFIVLYDIFVRRLWKKTPYWFIILLFSVSAVLTAVLTREGGLVSGVKSCILTLLPLYAFYPVCLMQEREKRGKAVIISLLGGSAVILVASAVAIFLFLARFSYYTTLAGITEFVGMRFYWPGRPETGILLYGFYVDTNHAAVFALTYAIYGIVLIVCGAKKLFSHKWVNVLAIVYGAVSALVQIVYFPLANSRGGWLCLGFAVVVAGFFYLYNCAFAERKMFFRVCVSVLVSAAVAAGIIGGMIGMRDEITKSSNNVTWAKNNGLVQQLIKVSEPFDIFSTEPSGGEGTSFSKDEVSRDGARLPIWKETIELFVKRPIMGTNPNNNAYYAQLYDVGHEKIAKGSAVHNSYLDLLLDYGAVGFVILMSFWVMCAVAVLKKQFTGAKDLPGMWYICVALVVITACCSMTLSCTFINTTATYFIMLLAAGYLMSFSREG